jgi:RimJ/RimL family protein N-acetyltransferase
VDLLRGKKVYLDRVKKADIPLLKTWWNDTTYQATLRRDGIFMITEETLEEWNLEPGEVMNRDFFGFAIRRNEDNLLVGNCGLMQIRWQARSCELFIGIGEAEMRGKGYGADGLRVLVNYAFQEMNMHRVGLVVGAFNTPAIQTYERVGFKHEGAMRDFVYRAGKHHDMLHMSILDHEWPTTSY